ncbi:flagellar basal-body rod protein FlgF [Alsobacter soli]|uniref:Flagellar basal-body rod protein FlgF n=1 Tax=Alsobacter soli TaxID=2109933 RepID=A0A2T1HU83_9HYPH|nr:flagellar basal-body rod protein FlgF [Alsobacter soli]PSC05233.1 flagellar basal-body rod protein FlgF [Alsobacter soli]
MENALLVGLSRQVALQRELDVVANNVANINTNGFKARSLRFEEYLMPKASGDSFQTPDRRISFVEDRETLLDMSVGPIERTGNPLDVAINGEAMLAVQTPKGERYTRNGALQINAQGTLVTSDGYPVMGDGGPVSFTGTEKSISIGPDGTISTEDGMKGKLKLVSAKDPKVFSNEGANLYASKSATQPAPKEVRIESGALERSNVKPVLEMSRLIEINRAYANISSMLQRYDEVQRSAIEKLAAIPA